ncbi:helix-turn-helix transcriptional regulator [Serratia grimesii]|jgi:DNA-binding NarL/FixJ family response regulator|uniref:helix-turn-helix transcriptional regulator n=1 Tax=Serratia grimesii TaxID=82995 RepID=UPI00077CC691|nr:LuxR C-terminal-related transcriptional regulator [Serratia grimesii]CAI0775243.1 colanic acid capsular biosynthesis activation protein A [Serratia grimesii]CAI2457390.1 colanic acid capsular biosynthesis activation protein A [Serratia grimesii]SUI32237.1 colanic acid capsular biosynthesis activation protein A [Serratia grimesii]
MTNTTFREAILFFEPNPWVRKGLRALIDPEPIDYQFVHSTRGIDAELKENEKQILIMELYNESESLYDVLRYILTINDIWPNTSLIIFTSVTNASILTILSTHVHLSLVAKEDSLDCLFDAIAATDTGAGYRSPSIKAVLHPSVESLSRSEWRILAMMIAGANPQRIASLTHRSYKTVSTHKLNIMRKLGLNQAGFMYLILAFRIQQPV